MRRRGGGGLERCGLAADSAGRMDEPIIDLQSDHYFMGEALRLAAKAYEAAEVPVGAVVVREGRIIARGFNQVELLKDGTAHASTHRKKDA